MKIGDKLWTLFLPIDSRVLLALQMHLHWHEECSDGFAIDPGTLQAMGASEQEMASILWAPCLKCSIKQL